MAVRGVLVDVDGLTIDGSVLEALDEIRSRRPTALATTGDLEITTELARRSGFVLDAGRMGLNRRDPRLLTMAAAGFACHPNEMAAVGIDPRGDVAVAPTIGGRGIWLRPDDRPAPRGFHPDATVEVLGELPAVLDELDAKEAHEAGKVGVGPHEEPWPEGSHLDSDLLAHGDRRNVLDHYRYWREEAIAADLARRARPLHVAVENWRRDRNIGTVVRSANGFGAAGVHIIGPRRWNRRGAMATDRYLAMEQHESTDAFIQRVREADLTVIAVDNVDGSVPIETTPLPERAVLVFGQEGPGITRPLLERADHVVHITQYGSTRSLNAGVAAGIAMHTWSLQHPVGRSLRSVPTV